MLCPNAPWISVFMKIQLDSVIELQRDKRGPFNLLLLKNMEALFAGVKLSLN